MSRPDCFRSANVRRRSRSVNPSAEVSDRAALQLLVVERGPGLDVARHRRQPGLAAVAAAGVAGLALVVGEVLVVGVARAAPRSPGCWQCMYQPMKSEESAKSSRSAPRGGRCRAGTIPGAVDRLGIAVGARARHLAGEIQLPIRLVGRASCRKLDSRAMVASCTDTGTPQRASVRFIARNHCGRSLCMRQASTTVLGGLSCPEHAPRSASMAQKGEPAPAKPTCLHLELLACLAARRFAACQRSPAKPSESSEKIQRGRDRPPPLGGSGRRSAPARSADLVRQFCRSAPKAVSGPVDRMSTGLYHRSVDGLCGLAGNAYGFRRNSPWVRWCGTGSTRSAAWSSTWIPPSATPRNGGSRSPRRAARARTSRSTTCSPRTRPPTTSPTSPSRTWCRTTAASRSTIPRSPEMFGALREGGRYDLDGHLH